MSNLDKRYGFWTAVAMVVGIVIGSGVFFKAEKILQSTNGDIMLGVMAWIVSGSIMIVCVYTFAMLAGKYAKVNGIVDYAEASLGTTFGYVVGWFMAVIYYPVLCAVLSWVSAKYIGLLFGVINPEVNNYIYILAVILIVLFFALNFLAPILAGKFQVSTTFIKIVPLILIAIIGIYKGLTSNQLIENFKFVTGQISTSSPFLTAVVGAAFAYEGWIIATTINAEIKDSRKNLPRALLIGSIVIIAIYISYFIGLTGTIHVTEFIVEGADSISLAFSSIFGIIGGNLLIIFVIISCLGTLNGLVLASTRGFYSLAVRGMGPKSKTFSKVNPSTNVPINSGFLAIVFILCWLLVWYGNFKGWWGKFLDFSELPVITMYALYIPIFVWTIKAMKELSFVKRVIVPILAIFASLFMIFATVVSHGISAVLIYILIFSVMMIVGLIFKNG